MAARVQNPARGALTSGRADCMQFVQEKNDDGILPQIYILHN